MMTNNLDDYYKDIDEEYINTDFININNMSIPSSSTKVKDLKDSYKHFLEKVTKPELEILRLHHTYEFAHLSLYPKYNIDKSLIPDCLSINVDNINIINKSQVLAKNTLLAIGYTYNLAHNNKSLTIQDLIKLKIFISDGSIDINSININEFDFINNNSLNLNPASLKEINQIIDNLNGILPAKVDEYSIEKFIHNYLFKLSYQINKLSMLLDFELQPIFLLNYWLLKNNLPAIVLTSKTIDILNNLMNMLNKEVAPRNVLTKINNSFRFNPVIYNSNLLAYILTTRASLLYLNKKYEKFSENTPTNPNIFKEVFNFNLLSQKDSINSWYIKRASYHLDYFTINDFYGDDNQGKGLTKEFKTALSNQTNFSDWLYGDEIPLLPEGLFEKRELVDFNAYLDVIDYKAFNSSFVYQIEISNIKLDDFKSRYRTLLENLVLLFRQKELSIRNLEFSEPDELGIQTATLTVVSDGICPNEHSFSFKGFKRKFPIDTTINIKNI